MDDRRQACCVLRVTCYVLRVTCCVLRLHTSGLTLHVCSVSSAVHRLPPGVPFSSLPACRKEVGTRPAHADCFACHQRRLPVMTFLISDSFFDASRVKAL